MNYYRRYMGDYAKKTAALSLAEHGAYNLLLDECYSSEKPLPGDYESLYRLCRAMNRAEQDAVKRVADRFFPIGPDGLRRNPRADEEIAIAQPAIAAAKTNGVKGGRPKRNPVGFDEEPNGQPTGGHPPTTNLQPPTSNLQKEQRPRSQGSRLPPDWKPSEILTAWASKERPDLDQQVTLDRFRDYWAALPGARGRKLDWDATFRNWVRSERAGSRPKEIDFEAMAKRLEEQERSSAGV